MRLIVGLGNPGPRYQATRHNVGFRVVEHLARRHGASLGAARFHGRYGQVERRGEPVGLLAPETYMNDSGRAVAAALAGLPPLDPASELLVVYDDLDLPLGRLRVRPEGGPGGHNGIRSILEVLERRDVPRLRFGVGRPPAGEDPIDYVLRAFEPEEEPLVADRVELAADACEAALFEGLREAMDRYNRAPEEADPGGHGSAQTP